MGTWTDLSDQDLSAKIERYRSAIESRELGETLKVVAGDGRRNEFFDAPTAAMKTTLAELLRERDIRNGDVPRGGYALGMRFLAR